MVQRQSTLLPVENWLKTQPDVRTMGQATATYSAATLPPQTTVDYFGDHVAFDVESWHRENGRAVTLAQL